MPRLFVAIPVDPMPALQDMLQTLYPLRGVRSVAKDRLHLTLRFLGDVADQAVDALASRLAAIGPAHARFDLELRGLGAFPDSARPRVVWCGCDDGASTKMRALADDVDTVCDDVAAKPREKPFTAHLTLARVKAPGGRAVDDLKRIITSNGDTRFGTLGVDRFALVASTLTPHGPLYDDVAEVALGP